jgi:hypothetical protein
MPALLAAAAALALATAPNSTVVKPADTVPGHPGLTYLDLAKQFAPSLAAGADGDLTGHLPATVRHLAGKEYEGMEPDPITLGFMQDERIVIGGKPRIALLADFGPDPDRVQTATFLLLFDDEGPTPRLLDAADVSMAEDTEYCEPPRVRLGGDDALIVYSEHDDADLAMGDYLLVSAAGDRLAMIDKFGVTSARNCGWEDLESARFVAAPDPGHTLQRLDVAVKVVVTNDPTADCGPTDIPKAQERTFHASYRWNPALGRFARIGAGLAGLDALNGEIYK